MERSGAIAQCFPVDVGGTVGHPTDPYGARPHVAVDAEGIIYIGNNNGVMRGI
ncbi:MAG: hypothetical protein HRF45_03335 [Fimbriimonadia bacterium]